MSGPWTEYEQAFWTPACISDRHEPCPHFSGLGGGLNLRRLLRPEFGASLCRCSCHSSCPVTPAGGRMTVPAETWYASCICPGAAQARRSLDEAGVEFPDFGREWEQARRRSQAYKESFRAARARAAGGSRAEIREIYLAELRSRGLKIPADPVLDAVVDHISGNPLPAARLLAESLAELGKGLYRLSRIFSQKR